MVWDGASSRRSIGCGLDARFFDRLAKGIVETAFPERFRSTGRIIKILGLHVADLANAVLALVFSQRASGADDAVVERRNE